MVPNERNADQDVVTSYRAIAAAVDRFIGFELSPLFHPAGRIWDLATYKEVLHIEQCIGAKHSSLEREPEWDRLRLRDAERPDFLVLTGNDLAIDMVMYGSDYLLGLSTFAPDLFASAISCGPTATPRSTSSTTRCNTSATSPSVRRSPPTGTRPPCSCACAVGSRATPHPMVSRAARTGNEALLRECGERLGLW